MNQKDFEDGGGETGVCPCCGSKNLNYGKNYKDNIGIIYPWTCPDCKSKGKETYEITFTGHYHE